VTAGAHRIELRYDPVGFRTGAALSLLTPLVWAAAAFGRRHLSTPAPERIKNAHSA
jgi:hypothetical protein